MRYAVAALGAALLFVGSAQAESIDVDPVHYGSAPVINSNGDLLSSNGGLQGISGFKVVTDGGTRDSVALRARSRDNNNTIVRNGSNYSVNPGYASGTTPNFYIEYQFTPGAVADYGDYILAIDIVGPNGFEYHGYGEGDQYWQPVNDGFLTNGEYGTSGTGATWHSVDEDGNRAVDTTTHFVLVNSWQIPWFDQLPHGDTDTSDYNPHARGTYDITFSVYAPGTYGESGPYLSNTISATVVPTPSAALGGLGLLALTALRRRKSATA